MNQKLLKTDAVMVSVGYSSGKNVLYEGFYLNVHILWPEITSLKLDTLKKDPIRITFSISFPCNVLRELRL